MAVTLAAAAACSSSDDSSVVARTTTPEAEPTTSSVPASTSTTAAATTTAATTTVATTTVATTTVAEMPGLTPVWTLTDPAPVSAPVAVDGLIVYYVARDGDLFLRGVDPATGSIKWEHEASPGAGPSGIALEVTANDQFVFFLRPLEADTFLSSLIVMRPSTGEEVYASEAWHVIDFDTCEDDAAIACLIRWDDDFRDRETSRLNPADGALTPDTNLPSGRRIGESGLFDVGSRDPEFIARAVGGTVLWEQPIAELFGDGFSTDYGWWWEHWPSQQTVAGHVGSEVFRDPGRRVPMALALGTVGVDEATGAMRWRDIGTELFCSGFTVDDESSGEPLPFRCRHQASTTIVFDDNNEGTFSSADIVLEGFDVLTGVTTWSVPLVVPDGLTLDGFTALFRRTAGMEFTVPSVAGQQLLDPRTGALRPIAPGDTFWCETEGTYEYHVAFETPTDSIFDRRAGVRVNACGPDGSSVAPQGALPTRYAAVAGGVAVIATVEGLQAYSA